MLIQKLGLVGKDDSGMPAAQDTDDQRLKVSVKKKQLSPQRKTGMLYSRVKHERHSPEQIWVSPNAMFQ